MTWVPVPQDRSPPWGHALSRSSGSTCGLSLPSVRHFLPFTFKAKVRLGFHWKALEADIDVCSCLSLFQKFSLGQARAAGWHSQLPLPESLWLWSSIPGLPR